MIYATIKELCTERGISIAECEKRAGIGNGVIAGWKSSSPMVKNLKAVADVLNVPVQDLLREKE